MRVCSRWFCTLLLFLCLHPHLRAQDLSGYVLSARDSLPLSNVTIAVFTADSTLLGGTVTDSLGYFSTAYDSSASYLLAGLVGYEDYRSTLRDGRHTHKIYLRERVDQLAELTVTASKKVYSRDKMGVVEAQVAGTYLENKRSVTDILATIPGVITVRGELMPVSGRAIAYFLNGKRIREISELSLIDPKTVQSIRVDTTPSVDMEATVGMIAYITIVTKPDIHALGTTLELQKAKYYSQYVSANYSLTLDKVSLYSSISYDRNRRYSFQDFHFRSVDSSGPRMDLYSQLESDPSYYNSLGYLLGADIRLKDHLDLGIKWNGKTTWLKDHSIDTSRVLPSGRDEIRLQSTSGLRDNSSYNHLIAQLTANAGESSKLSLTAEAANNRSTRRQEVVEKTAGEELLTSYDNNNDRWVFSLLPKWMWQPSEKVQWTFGGEGTLVKARGRQEYRENSLPTRDHSDREYNAALYVGINGSHEPLAYSLGIRYERFRKELVLGDHHQEDGYGYFLPYGKLNFTTGLVTHMLNLSSRILRPSLGALSSFSYYSNRFTTQEGNPALRSTGIHEANYTIGYRSWLFQANYQHLINPFYQVMTFRDNDDGGAFVATWMNLLPADYLTLYLNYNGSFGWYHPNISLMHCTHVNRIELDNGGRKSLKNPLLMLTLIPQGEYSGYAEGSNYCFWGRAFLLELYYLLSIVLF